MRTVHRTSWGYVEAVHEGERKQRPWWLDPRRLDPWSERALDESRTMRRYMPLTGGLTVFFALVLIVLGFVLLGYEEVGSALLLFAIGTAGLVLVPLGHWIVRREKSAGKSP
jgi:hypothetical protein